MHHLAFIHLFGQSVSCIGTGNADTCNTGLPTPKASSANLQHGLQAVFATLAVVAVLFVVISGLKFVAAQGDPQAIAKARQTIIYAVIGLVICISAEAIVSLVLGKS